MILSVCVCVCFFFFFFLKPSLDGLNSSPFHHFCFRYIDGFQNVFCTQRHRLDADKFPMFSVRWTWQGFWRDLDPCWSE